MAKTWLGFWDLGQPVGKNSGLATNDGGLFSLLFYGLSRSAHFKAWRLTLPPVAQLSLMDMNSMEKIAVVHQYLKHRNWSNAVDTETVHPAHLQVAGDAVVAGMNRTIFLDEPDTPLASRLRSPTGFSPGLPGIEGESNVHSPWLGLAPGTGGPRYSMNFWDVSDAVGVGGVNRPGDVTLVTWLMTQMLSHPDFTKVKGQNPFGRLTLSQWIALVAARCQELGWPVANPKVVAPTGGAVAAPSLIRPLNYYAFKSSGQYPHLANRDLSPSSVLWGAVRENVDSLYIKLTA
jgi:hypothetical protein